MSRGLAFGERDAFGAGRPLTRPQEIGTWHDQVDDRDAGRTARVLRRANASRHAAARSAAVRLGAERRVLQ